MKGSTEGQALQIILSKFKIDVYADNPTISPIFVVRELLDFRVTLAQELMGESTTASLEYSIAQGNEAQCSNSEQCVFILITSMLCAQSCELTCCLTAYYTSPLLLTISRIHFAIP